MTQKEEFNAIIGKAIKQMPSSWRKGQNRVPIYTCDIATKKLFSQEGHLRGIWKTYEEACEAAIKHCLTNML